MKLLYIFLFFFPVSLFAQDSTSSGAKKWAMGIILSPDYCYRTLTHDRSIFSDFIVDSRNEYETPKYGASAGIRLYYILKNRFSLEMGADYTNSGYSTKSYSNFIVSMPNDPLIPEKISYKYNYHFVSVPLLANFLIGKKNVKIIFSGGLLTNVLIERIVTQTQVFTNNSTSISKYKSQQNFNTLNLAVQVGAGMDATLTKKLHLRLQPVFRFDTGVLQTTPVKEHLWSAGLNLGVFLKM